VSTDEAETTDDRAGSRSGWQPTTVESARDLLCVACGYNLRTLRRDQNCPECGTPVTRSMCGNLLSASDPHWLARICRGQALIYASCVLLLVGPMLALLAYGVVDFETIPVGVGRATLLDVIRRVVLLIPACLFLLGILRVTSLDPRLSLTEQPLALRGFVRWAGVATVMALVVRLTLPSGTATTGAGPGFASVCRLTSKWVFLLVGLSALVAGLYYLAGLAERTPEPELIRKGPTLPVKTRRTARRLAVCVVLTIVLRAVSSGAGGAMGASGVVRVVRVASGILTVAVVVYMLSVLSLMSYYRIAFKRSLKDAQRLGG